MHIEKLQRVYVPGVLYRTTAVKNFAPPTTTILYCYGEVSHVNW